MLEQRLPEYLLQYLVQRLRGDRLRLERLLQPPVELLPRLHMEVHGPALCLRRLLRLSLPVLTVGPFPLWFGLPVALLVGLMQQALP